MFIRELFFQNFKTIKDKIEIKNLKNINYFIGQNGVGKSNIFLGIEKISNSILNDKLPNKNDHFDKNTDEELKLGFTIELSLEEQTKILKNIGFDIDSELNLEQEKIFQSIQYELTCKNGLKESEIFRILNAEGNFQTVIELIPKSEGNYQLSRRNSKTFILDSPTSNSNLDISHIQANSSKMDTSFVLSTFDDTLQLMLNDFFKQLAHIPNYRISPSSQNAQEQQSISINGSSLPNELHTKSDDREAYQNYEKEVKNISFVMDEVFAPMKETSTVIKIKEAGLQNKVDHSELSSGFKETLILTNILQHIPSLIILIEEPELHLNARSQKKLLELIQNRSDNKQYFIETHSPIFTGVTDKESTYLISKHNGSADIIEINKENIGQIKIELGISHADVFDNDCLCFVEGLSEYEAFPIIAKKLGYTLGHEFRLWNLKGYGNLRNIRTLLKYLKSSDRKIFLLLDKNQEAIKLKEKIVEKDLIDESMCIILDKNFEDLFPSELIIEKMNEISKDLGIDFKLSVDELESKRSAKSVDSILTEYWNKNFKENNFSKPLLGTKMVSSIPDDEVGDNEFAKIVKKILDAFEIKPSQ